ncbi:hypothetical protein K491DRAFT_716235 [Lophiostoma macrostomum CBS 122681]|uniref:BTB domain-containing protein n=1 Tax=Lophiostoma macrostomum CBS 122681 TaxID=1314788 RepID=A0A6A6T6P7_9PLEO|nr:hypothetical protein K491DRAFT_716235 [Lophiostoma macrostomum CBS 122681]
MSSETRGLIEMILNKKLPGSSLTTTEKSEQVVIRNKKGDEIGHMVDIRLLSHTERMCLLRGPSLNLFIGSDLIGTISAAIIKTATGNLHPGSGIHLPPDFGKEEVKYLISYLTNICIMSKPFPLPVRKNLAQDLAVVRVAWQLGMPLYVQHLSDHYWNYIKTCVPTDGDIRAVELLDFHGTFTKDKRWFFHMALRLARLRRNSNSTLWNQRKQVFENTAMLSAVESAYTWLQKQQGQKSKSVVPQKRELITYGKKGKRRQGRNRTKFDAGY